MPTAIARVSALVAAFVVLLAVPAASSAAPMVFGSDLSGAITVLAGGGTYTYAQTQTRTSPAGFVPAGAPQSGVGVQMKIKKNGNGAIKFRILRGTVPTLSSRVARPDGNLATGHAVTGTATITTFDPVDGMAH